MITRIEEKTEKANHVMQIDCRRKKDRCPITPEDNIKYKKYRSITRCWGCRYAFWILSDDPYGPREFQRTKFVKT